MFEVGSGCSQGSVTGEIYGVFRREKYSLQCSTPVSHEVAECQILAITIRYEFDRPLRRRPFISSIDPPLAGWESFRQRERVAFARRIAGQY